MAFNLTATLNLQRQVNIRPLLSSIQSQLDKARFTISVNLDSRNLARVETILNRNARAADSLNASLSNVSNTAYRLGHSLSGHKISSGSIKSFNSELSITKSRISAIESVSQKTLSNIVTESYLAYKALHILSSQFSSFVEFQGKLTKYGQVAGYSVERTRELGIAIRKTAIEFGVSSGDIADLSTELLRAGVSSEKIRQSLSLFAKLSLSESVDDLKAAGKAIIVLDRVFGQSSDQIESSLNKIAGLSSSYAVETSDVIKGLSIAGPLWRQLGGDVESFAATFASTAEANQLSAETNAHAIKTLLSRMNAPETISTLEKFGISLRDSSNNFVGPEAAIKKLHDSLGQLPDQSTEKIQVLTQLGGVRQLPILISLLNSYSRQLEAKNLLERDSAKLTIDAALAQKSLAVQLQSLQETVKRDFAAIFDNKAVGDFTQNIFGLTKAFSGLLPVISPLLPVVALLGAKSLAGRSNIGGLAASGVAGIGSSFASGYNQQTGRTAPTGRVLPSPNQAATTRQLPVYTRNPHFQSGLEGIGGQFGRSFAAKSITQQITTVNKLSGLFSDLSLSDRKLAGAMQHYVLQINDGISSEEALANTRKALARVMAKEAGRLGVQTSYAQLSKVPESGNVLSRTASGLGALYRSHGNQIAQGGAGLGLLLNGQFNSGASQQLVETGLSTGLGASMLGANPATSAAIGIGAAVLNYSDAIEQEAKRIENSRISSALDNLAIRIKLEGDKLGAGTLASGKSVLATLNEALSNSRKEVGYPQALIAGTKSNLGSLLSGDFGNLDGSLFGASQKIQEDRGQQFQQTLRQSSDALLSFRQQILASGVKSISEFESYGNGFGKELLGLLSHLDPAIRRTTENLIAATDSKQLTEAIGYNLANSISKSAVEIDAKRRSLSPAYKLGTGRTDFDATEIGTAAYGRQLGKLGLSKEIESTLKDVNTVSRVGPGVLAGGKDFGKDTFAESVANQLRQEGVGEKVAAAIQDSLEQAGYEKFKESLTDIEKASGDLLSQFHPLVNSTERLRAAQLELVSTRNANFATAAGQYGSTVDANIQAKLASLSVADTVSRYRKGPLDTGAGNLLAKQGAIALGGSSDTVKLGHNLKLLSEQFEKTKDVRYLETIKQTEQALRLLGDTTLRTKNIEEELNKAKSAKEAKLGAAEAFLSQDRKGRMESLRGLGLAAQATKVGSLNGFDIPSQQKIIATLRSVSDVKLGNGLTGKENLENLIKNSFPGLVAGEDKTIDDLTKESIKIQIDAAAASKELAINQERQLNNFLVGLGNENRTFLTSLGTLLSTPAAILPRRATGGYVSGPGGPRGDKIPAMLSDGEYVINAAAAARLGPERLHALNSVHAASGGGAIQLARRQGISLADARSQLRLQTVRGAYQRTVNYIAGKRHLSRDLNNAMVNYGVSTPAEAFRYARFENSRLGRLGGIQRNGRYRDEFRRKGNRFADGGPVSAAGGNVASGISSAMGQFQSSVLVLSQAVNQLAKINIPSHITFSGTHDLNVTLNGMAQFSALEPRFKELIVSAIDETMKRHFSLEQRISPQY